MAKFRYESIDKAGKTSSGVIEAPDKKGAVRLLQEQGYFPTSVASAGEEVVAPPQPERKERSLGNILSFLQAREIPLPQLTQKIDEADLVNLFRQWASLISAGIPLIRSLSTLIEQAERPSLKKILSDIRRQVDGGSTLAKALESHKGVFSPLQIDMLRSGELGGMLEISLERLAGFLEGDQELKSRVRTALVYPVFLIGVVICVVGVFMVFVLPRLSVFFEEMEQALPIFTILLINIGKFFKWFWWLLILLFMGGVFGFRGFAASEQGRARIDEWKLKIPLFGSLLRRSIIARFSRTLATLLEGGIPLLSALEIAEGTTANLVFSRAVLAVRENIHKGESFATPMRRSGVFPPLVCQMIAVGEESGRLSEMLIKVSENYDRQVTVAIRRMTSLLEPIIILVMTVIVGFVVLAILLPILNMSTLVR